MENYFPQGSLTSGSEKCLKELSIMSHMIHVLDLQIQFGPESYFESEPNLHIRII